MMTLKRILAIVALCIVTCTLWAQNEVSLVVSSEGKDKEEATLKALRSAIEQAYGTFVSANTTVLNDQLVADEIVSLSSGNIQKYEYVSEAKMPDGSTYVTLSATVSIDKLVAFAESKGMEVELKGGLFAMNIKKMEFDKKAEEKAVENLCKQLEAMLPTLFDYEIEIDEPKLGESGDDVELAFRINAQCNDNMLNFSNTLIKNLVALSLTGNECQYYNKINQRVFDFIIWYPELFLVDKIVEKGLPNCLSSLFIDREPRYWNCWGGNNDIRFGPVNYYEFINYYNEHIAIANFPLQTRITEASLTEVSLEELKKEGEITVKYDKYTTLSTASININIEIPTFHLRSSRSLQLIGVLFNRWRNYMYDVEVSDDIRKYRIAGIQNLSFDYEEYEEPEYEKFDCYDFYRFGVEKHDGIVHSKVPTFYAWRKYVGGDCDYVRCFWSSRCYGLSWDEDQGNPISNDKFRIYIGVLHYSKDEISSINKISVNNPVYPEANSTPKPQESKSSNSSNAKQANPQSKITLYNDTLQQAVNEYNTLLRKFPYNYNENKIAFALSSSLPDDEGFLHDTLHSLLDTINAKKAQLVVRYKKDSLEFQQLSNSYQEKIDEANVQFLKYPYNLQKRTLKDSLSISLFGKTEELTKQLHTKVAALPQLQEQAEKEVYAETKKNNPQRFTEIYFTQNPTAKQKADSTYLECRCSYDGRLTFDMDFINNALPECNCREKKYQYLKTLYHSREEFDQSYNQEESAFKSEVTDRKKMWKEIKKLEEMLSNWKQLNTKKALSSTKTEIVYLLNLIKQHQGSYYYNDAVDVIFAYDEKLSKEWFKNGSYFKSKNEMFEYWIGEEYDKVLKARKK